jgi:L-amino acid N-acyltransferase
MSESSNTPEIRAATPADVMPISDLYNALIDTTTIAWTEHKETLETRTVWFENQRALNNPVLVADVCGDVVGFATFGDFRDAKKWPGYRFVVEHTIHVRRDYWGTGVARELLTALMNAAVELEKVAMIGGIDGANVSSIRFHEKLGFVEVARMPQIGFKFGRWLDLVLMQKDLRAL